MKKATLTLLCLTLSIPSYARTITVDADRSGKYPTIQAAIDAANDGDVIILNSGTYTGPCNRDIDFLGKAITVRSEKGLEHCIINCQALGRGCNFISGEGEDTVLDGLTITNGRATDGGGIYCVNSNPTLINLKLDGNHGDRFGGGIYNDSSNPTLRDCVFSGNSALSPGGGVANYFGSSPRLTNCSFNNNSASHGGGMYNDNSILMLTNCAFIGNSAYHGGGIHNYRGQPRVFNCTFVGNLATSFSGKGGGINNVVSSPIVTNCIIWSNFARGDGDQIHTVLGVPVINYSCIQGWTGVFEGAGNTGSNPRFVNPKNGDYRLLEDSPCINAGDPGYPYDPNETDLDGNPRIIDGRIDMGAYEFNLNTAPVVDAGPNQTAYAWIDGIADVALDGSASYDEDGDELTYFWSWQIGSDVYEANGVNPIIELPVGEHIIELIVNDGTEDSEPNCTTVTVIEPLHSFLRIMPRTINRRNRQRYIIAWLSLPEGVTKDDIDSNVPLTLYPGDIEASRQFIFESDRYDNPGAFILAFFNKSDLMNAVPEDGQVQLEAVGQLNTDRYFFGQRKIRIINPPHEHPRRINHQPIYPVR